MKRLDQALSNLCGFTVPNAVKVVAAYAAQNPGLEYGNYASGWNDKDGRRAYFSESRAITRDWHRVCKALTSCAIQRVTNQDILDAAARAFSGRLTVTPLAGFSSFKVDYCTGQYWPTEYRKAAASVLELAATLAYRRNVAESAKAAA